MAFLRASFASAMFLRSSASIRRFSTGSMASGVLHSGQRLAKPGLSGFSSNSSLQMIQTLIGNAIRCLFYDVVDVGGVVPCKEEHGFGARAFDELPEGDREEDVFRCVGTKEGDGARGFDSSVVLDDYLWLKSRGVSPHGFDALKKARSRSLFI